MTAGIVINPPPRPNADLIRAVLAAGATDLGINFLREIAFRSPEWVRSDTIEQRLNTNSNGIGGIHRGLRAVVEAVSHQNQPSPWATTESGGGVFAWYLMTEEVAAIVLAHPAPSTAPPPPVAG
jgi:hypothetical protein